MLNLIKVFLCLLGIFWTSVGMTNKKADWLMSQKPCLVLRAERGELKSYRLQGLKEVGTTDNALGKARSFSAMIEPEAGISLRVEELLEAPALILWLELKEGLEPAEMGKTELIPMGIELDLPKEYPFLLSFQMSPFAPPEDRLVPSAGPVLFYDQNFKTVMVSPLDHFLVSMITPAGKTRFQIGLEGDLKYIPAGFQHPIIFYFGQGIRNSFLGWGELLRGWYGRKIPDPYAEIGISYLGYWTDNGAYYYYNTEKGLNYEETLLRVKEDADRLGVPFRYFQVDSWWYFKAGPKRTGIGPLDWVRNLLGGGVIKWEARPDLFPEGLEGFQRKLGLPLIAHNRWYDKETDYKKDYQFVDGFGERNPAFPIEERFWEMIMDQAVKYGVKVYEQDWLDTQWDIIPYLRERIDAGERWLAAMSRSAQKRGLYIQYCMANPGMFMQAVKYANVTEVRCSDDYLAGAPKQFYWVPFTKVSMLAWACGLYPWKDTFLSSPGQRTVRDERRNEEEALLSVLSAGMVGPGDRIGFLNKPLLMKTCRKDGLLLKPDLPAMPIDKMFLKHNTLYTIITETETGLGTYYYVAGFNIYPERYLKREVSFKELGIKAGSYLVYDWHSGSCQSNQDRIIFPKNLKIYDSAYYVLVPKQAQGIELVGEKDKFISVAKARFKNLELKGSKLWLSLSGVRGEEIELLFRAEQKPGVEMSSGAEILASDYDPMRKFFWLKLKFNAESAQLKVGN